MTAKNNVTQSPVKIRSWDWAILLFTLEILGVILFAGNLLGAIAMLASLPTLFWVGWTQHAKHLVTQAEKEQALLEKFKAQGKL